MDEDDWLDRFLDPVDRDVPLGSEVSPTDAPVVPAVPVETPTKDAQLEADLEQLMTEATDQCPQASTPCSKAPTIPEMCLPMIKEMLEPVRLARGPLTRKARGSSICTGIASEHPSREPFEMPTDYLFGCDSKEAAFNFTQDNGPKFDAYFVDCHDIEPDLESSEADSDNQISGRDALKDFAITTLLLPVLLLEWLIAGVSCRPFSVARAGRHSGTVSHSEADLVPIWLKLLFKFQPKFSILENVFGFCLQENTLDKVSPLQRLIRFMKEQEYPYIIRVFILCGSTFLKWKRRRVFVSVIHKSAGGESASLAQEIMIKAGSHVRETGSILGRILARAMRVLL